MGDEGLPVATRKIRAPLKLHRGQKLPKGDHWKCGKLGLFVRVGPRRMGRIGLARVLVGEVSRGSFPILSRDPSF